MKRAMPLGLLAAALLSLNVPRALVDDPDVGAGAQPVTAPEPKPARHPVSRTIVYPVLATVPLFGASVRLPPIEGPGGGEGPSGSTGSSFNGAALAGFRIDRDRWLFEVSGLWAGLSAEREAPRVKVESDVVYGNAVFGWRVYQDVLLTAGVRRMAVKLGAEVEGFPKAERKPGVWDPLVGVAWRKPVSRSFMVEAAFQGGGFGVGADVDLGGHLFADWRFSDRFGLALGYQILYFKLSDTVAGKTLETTQTLHGPVLGFGIYFGKR